MVTYRKLAGCSVTEGDLQHCSELFSGHYGVWRNQKGRVRATAAWLKRELLFDEAACLLVIAEEAGRHVGHAFACQFELDGHGTVSWITQLVVHADHRHKGIGTALCRAAWAGEGSFACGLLSCHPYAVQSVERATVRLCDKQRTAEHMQSSLQSSGIPYAKQAVPCIDERRCLVDTGFFVDHTGVNELLKQESDWQLGELEEGKEFAAFTFMHSAV